MRIIILSAMIMAMLFSCSNPSPSTENHTMQEDSDAQVVTANEETASEEASAEIEVTSAIIPAVFEDATVYAGATDFTFALENGEMYQFRRSNTDGMTEEELEAEKEYLEGMNIVIHEELIDPSEDLEGPPGGNPAYIGKTFNLTFDENGKLIEVKLAAE